MYNYFCCFQEDKNTHKELRWRIFNWSLFFWVSICVVGMFAALIVGGIYGINQNNIPLAAYSFVMSSAFVIPCLQLVYYVWRFFAGKKSYAKIDAKFLEDIISVNEKLTIPYSQIKRIIKTKNYLLLIRQDEKKNQTYLPIKKDACNCNWKTLIHFIDVKRKQQTIPRPTL